MAGADSWTYIISSDWKIFNMKLHVVMPVINCHDLTVAAIKSIGSECVVHLIDNASTDQTQQWGIDNNHSNIGEKAEVYLNYLRNEERMSVSQSWNWGIKKAFEDRECEYVAVLNNDIVLHPKTLDHLMKFMDKTGYLMTTGDNIKDRMSIEVLQSMELPVPFTDFDCQEITDWRAEGPDFSCFLINRNTIKVVGWFDEGFEGAYCEDQDYHVRCQRAYQHAKAHKDQVVDANRIHFKRLSTAPYYHYASQTIARNISMRPDISTYHGRNENYYLDKWGANHNNAMDGHGNTQPLGDATKNWRYTKQGVQNDQ